MSKQAKPPPPGGKPAPTAPPPPPALAELAVADHADRGVLALWLILPTVHSTPTTSLTYSQFLSDVAQHKVKTCRSRRRSGGTSTGTLKRTGPTTRWSSRRRPGQTLLTDLHPTARDGVRGPVGARASAPRC